MTDDTESADDGAASEPKGHAVEPDRRLLEMLVCPLTKAALVYRPETNELVSVKAALAFPIKNGVPLLTEDAARPLRDDELPRR
ncbi:MAG: Trm112 family protein [Hyphomicrobium sp.]|nr:Trm112 family protein [Hyphomicrobium sp.]